jgi:hypothetical protein
MNQQALDNRAYVRNLILKKEPELFVKLETAFLNLDTVVVGFGACETDVYPEAGCEEFLEW